MDPSEAKTSSSCVVVLLLALVAALCLRSAAAEQPANGNGENPMRPPPALDPYLGVIVDSTVTFIGHEFYRSFVAVWRDQDRVDRYSLTIIERPSARWGSLVWVEYRNRRVFSAFLSPGRRDHVRQSAREAARQVYDAIVQADLQRLLFRDADLAGDEF